jgi:DNA-binding GntR family transcriptional regulator
MSSLKTALAPIDETPRTLRDIVQDRMRAAIIDGHFEPGERLVERPLCDQLGVSRTVVRETIRYLEAEGLVEILPNRGPIVATLDWDQARQIYAIRRQLEGAAAADCARLYSEDFPPTLQEALSQLEAAMRMGERTELLLASTALYALIFREAGHAIAWEIVQRLNGRISRLRALTLSARDRSQPGIAHMSQIVSAILGRDSAAALAAVEAHIDDAAAVARGFLDGEAAEAGSND